MRERTEMAKNANSVRTINSMILQAPGEQNEQGCQSEVNRPSEQQNQQLRILGKDKRFAFYDDKLPEIRITQRA